MLISFRRATEMFQFAHYPPSLPMCSAGGLQTSLWRGCPIRNLRAHGLHAAPPERFAGLRVLLRLSAPRHPPRTLCSLFFFILYVYLLIPRSNDALDFLERHLCNDAVASTCGQQRCKEVPTYGQERGKEASASLLLYGKIEVRKDSVVHVQDVGTPTSGEWKTA